MDSCARLPPLNLHLTIAAKTTIVSGIVNKLTNEAEVTEDPSPPRRLDQLIVRLIPAVLGVVLLII